MDTNFHREIQITLIMSNEKLKFLSVEVDKRQKDLLEETIQDILKKYEKKPNK